MTSLFLKRPFFKFCSIALLLCVSFNLFAQEYSTKFKEWSSIHSSIGKVLESQSKLIHSQDELRTFRQQLRQIKVEATDVAENLKQSLQNQRDLLKTLGEAPTDGSVEDSKIKNQRKRINADINLTDTELKQTNLIIAQSDDHLLKLEFQQKQKIKEKLFSKIEIPSSISTLQTIWKEILALVKLQSFWLHSLFVSLGVILLLLLSRPITSSIRHLINSSPNIELLKDFRRSHILFLIISSYFVFLLRFSIISVEKHPFLENIIHAATCIFLSVSLYRLLGKISFIPSEKSSALGEKKTNYSWLWNVLRRILRAVLFLTPFAAVLGYINLAQYLSFNLLISVASILLFFTLRGLVLFISQKQISNSEETSTETKKISPLTIAFAEPILALFCTLIILFFWGMTTEDLESFIIQYRKGITIGDITINFVAIFSSIIFFFTLYYLTKLIQWFLASRVLPHTNFDTGVLDAIISITGYVGVILALLTAMGTLGLNMSNLAIVAGALSVGIGFGLQAICNNFVSGLILLFERPVKVGDWIIVGDKQGTIKKIRVRSTEIETFWNSSVIVPNSQLISETVTNWTLHDRAGRVDVSVGVAYGSDTDTVRKVLLEIARNHPDVKDSPKPTVHFKDFGESSLDLELRCYIWNIRDVFSVSSELRFVIDQKFREHDICIPFPQRDVHMIPPSTPKEPMNPVEELK